MGNKTLRKLAVIGAGGHGKVVADIARQIGYEEIIFLDDRRELTVCGNYHVIGKSGDAAAFAEKGYDLSIAIGDAKERQRIQESLEAEKITCVTLIHPNAVIADDVGIGKGSVVMAGTVINPGSIIGKGCIINTCASVDHDCRMEDFVHVAVGAHLAGNVHVGARTWIGAGAVVSNDVEICADCMIGAGTVIVRNIGKSGTYVGVPAEQV